MEITDKEKLRLDTVISQLRTERYPFWTLWRELADYFLPKRYVWLQSDRERRIRNAKNPFILDSTGTKAARVLASGMMNGITSPSRPWFKLRVPGYDDEGGPVTIWADEVARRMMKVMGESNFYNSMAVLYLDLGVFGSAANLIYEDDETVIRCYNPALGEFYFGQDHRLQVNRFAREFSQTACQIVEWFGLENCSDTVKSYYRSNSSTQQLSSVELIHLVEPNTDSNSSIPSKFKFVETYWEKGMPGKKVLAQRGMNELPGIFPRWELTANDSYGTSPGMDALPDVIQLQQETKRKAQGLDKMINPPVVADIQLQHRPTALMPNGITYVAGANGVGVKPLYEIRAPIQEMTQDIRDVQVRIRETFFNELFQMISQLETVRSATEIDARREEKLVLLGSVLERFENEALDPAINRVYSIMQRRNMLPPAPQDIEDQSVEIQYVSILATAQQAIAAAPTERWLGVIGNLAAIVPEVLKIPNWDEVVRTYGLDIGVQAKLMRTRDEVQEEIDAQKESEAAAQAGNLGMAGVQAAKLLSETEVGGGANALQQLQAQQ